jgi:hypothetical protein
MALVLVLLLAAASAALVVLTRDREDAAAAPPGGAVTPEGLTLLIVRTGARPFGAVVGSTGRGGGALVVPGEAVVTIPGQGDGTVADALGLSPRLAATTVANLLGLWVDHAAVIGPDRLQGVIDRVGGIEVGGDVVGGADAVTLLSEAGEGATAAFGLVLEGLLSANVTWQPSDLGEADEPTAVIETLEASGGATVASVPVTEVAANVHRAEPGDVRAAVVEAFGGPDREVVDVIVLNGSGVPGVGELVAERIVPAGFRIVVSENASEFDHLETLVVVGSADDVALGERVRDLLGTGTVNVSVPSGIAPVTIVVGKDFSD